jgi:hypothetical protein
MTNVVRVNLPLPWQRGNNLNVRQLFNPLFFTPNRRHPDQKRQRKARLKARTLRQARELKARAVPLRLVDPTVYPRRWNDVVGRWECEPT